MNWSRPLLLAIATSCVGSSVVVRDNFLSAGSNCSWTARQEQELREILGWQNLSRPQRVRDEAAAFWQNVDRSEFTVRVVNVGLGTTGTHFPYHASCKAGLPSVHFTKSCNANKKHLVAHKQLIRLYIKNWVTLKGLPSAERVRSLLRNVLTSGVVTLHDTPYSFLVDEIVTAVPDVRIFYTQRNPEKYAKRRLELQHDYAKDFLCKQQVIAAYGGASHFDMVGCLHAVRSLGLSSRREAFERIVATDTPPHGWKNFAARVVAHTHYVMAAIRPHTRFLPLCLWDTDAAPVERMHAMLRETRTEMNTPDISPSPLFSAESERRITTST